MRVFTFKEDWKKSTRHERIKWVISTSITFGSGIYSVKNILDWATTDSVKSFVLAMCGLALCIVMTIIPWGNETNRKRHN